ncbi:MAG: xanthine dehydrogenase family protein subunit M [Thermodesulfobacteriota bacterium]
MIPNLSAFEYVQANSIEQACNLLAGLKKEGRVIAGGTDLLVRMKHRASIPEFLLSLNGIQNLDRIEESEDEVIIGALTKLHKIQHSCIVRDNFLLLSDAAGKVAHQLIRNMGTIGGNICLDARCEYYTHSHIFGLEYWPKCFKRGGEFCHIMKKGRYCYARFSADTVPALVALNARVTIVSHRSQRSIPLEEFYTGRGHPVNILQPDEILTEIRVPKLYSKWKGVYFKYSCRKAIDYPVVGVAALADMSGGVCKEIRIVAVSVASSPVRMKEVEDMLRGVRLSDHVISEAERIAIQGISPIPHHGDSPRYIRTMLGTFIKKALLQIID